MTLKKVICTGSVDTEDQAIEWLKQRGATTEDCAGITIIELPESARLEKDGYEWRYSISFYGPDGNDESQYIEMELYADASETILRLKGEAEAQENQAYFKIFYTFVYHDPDKTGIPESFSVRFLLPYAKAPAHMEKIYQPGEEDQAHQDIKAKANEQEPQEIQFIESTQEFDSIYSLYTIESKAYGEEPKRRPLGVMGEEEAFRQVEATKISIVLTGQPGYVKLFKKGQQQPIKIETIFA